MLNFIFLSKVSNLIKGQYQDFLKVFSELLNFQLRQFRRQDGGWGSRNSDTGQWSGMVSNLVNGEADLISVALSLAPAGRTDAMDFIWTLSEGTSGFVIKGKIQEMTKNKIEGTPILKLAMVKRSKIYPK